MKILLLNIYSRNAFTVLETSGENYEFYGADIRIGNFFSGIADKIKCHKKLKATFRYANPIKSPDQFVSDIIQLCKDNDIEGIIPTGTEASNILSMRKSEIQKQLPSVHICIDKYAHLEELTDKWLFYQKCVEVGISVPKAVGFSNKKDARADSKTIAFPAVYKPTQAFASAGLEFFSTREEFLTFVDNQTFNNEPYILQERVDGNLYDIAFVSFKGKTLARYAQSRTVGVYDFGGGGAMVEPIPLPALTDKLEKILKEMSWSGIAEFDLIKDSTTGEFLPIECNPKIWGTSITPSLAGSNFIESYMDSFLHGKMTTQSDDYSTNIAMRFWFPEGFMHLLNLPFTPKKLLKRIGNMRANPEKRKIHSNLRPKNVRHHIGLLLNQVGKVFKNRNHTINR